MFFGLMFLIMCFFPNCLYVGLLFGIPLILFGVILIIIGAIQRKIQIEKNYACLNRSYADNMEIRNSILKSEEKKYNEAMESKKQWNTTSVAYEQELSESTKDILVILEKAYNANIIPMPFRTIEGVYYLYDYLSTSNQTLSEALMQANLEAIKQKLDQMIQLQSVQIIEQAQTNAKLDEINETNNRILATAQQNAKNTALAAKYAAIAAVNTEMIARLNKQQLAYQRADFWLK